MTNDERGAAYLETGAGGAADDTGRIDLIRAVLAEGMTWTETPEGLLERVTSETGVQGTRLVARRRLWRPAPTVGIAAALLLVLLSLLLTSDSPEGGPSMVVAMSGTELAPDATGRAVLRETPSGWYVRLELSGLPPAPEDAYYESWMWRGDEGVSIGTFHMRGGPEPVALWSGVSPADFPAIRITLQQVGAGPMPSNLVVARGVLGD